MIGSFLLPADVEFATRRRETSTRRDVGHAAGPVSGARSLGERFMLFARRVVVYWKGAVTIVGANDSQGIARTDAERAVGARVVRDGHVGLLYVDGKLTATLRPGLHAFWRYRGTVEVDLVDVRVRLLELPAQHILTRDKVPLRVGVTASYRLADAARAARTLQDPADHLRNEIQLGLRVAVGDRALDGLLEDRVAIDRTMTRRVARRVADHGIVIRAIGLTDIVLPAEMQGLINIANAKAATGRR
jgi:uncharacterized membrane protein YqiK